MCNNDRTSNCISEILNVILVLQQNACPNSCLDSCDRPVLGGGPNCLICNTRPIQIFTCGSNGVALSMPTTKDTTDCTDTPTPSNCSNVFRIEKIDGCCATFRVLAPNTDPLTQAAIPYVSTNSFFTMNLNCVCSLRCLQDTYVECL